MAYYINRDRKQFEQELSEQARLQQERLEQERLEQERLEQERLEEERRREELREAESEKANHENALSDKEKKFNENNEKIKRLREVQTCIEEDKRFAEGRYIELKKYFENEDTFVNWYGNKCDHTKQNFSETIIPKYKEYVDNIDEVLDAVCDEITRLENENYKLNDDIGWLLAVINSLLDKIRTLCN